MSQRLFENEPLNDFRRKGVNGKHIEDGKVIAILERETDITTYTVPNEPYLQYLNLSDNENLTEVIFTAPLPELVHLDFSDSNVEKIVFEKGFHNLEWLDISRNGLTSIEFKGNMPLLNYLDLSGNKLDEFSLPTIFPKMEYLYLIDSEPSNLPKEVYVDKKNCWEDVRNYLKASLLSGDVINNEAKFIFFGNGRAGKTTLSHQLRKGVFDKTIEYTHGILVNDWKIPSNEFSDELWSKVNSEIEKYAASKGEVLEAPDDIHLNVWDFGGQEYFHATHRLFLNNNVMYTVVWEKATNQQDDKGNYPVPYWEKNINHYASNNHILYVQNKEEGDAIINHKNGRYKVRNRVESKQATIGVYDLDVETLKEGILKELPKLEYLGTPIAKIYNDIRTELKRIAGEKKFLSFSEYRDLCQKMDETDEQIMQNESDLKSVTEFLHETGSLVCYRYKKEKIGKELDDYVFINPGWVTNTIYQILDEKTEKNGGEFSKTHVVKVLKENNNEVINSNLWIDLMKEFELIFEKEDKPENFIVPQYLPKGCNDLSEKAMSNLNDELPFLIILKYPEFLPRSILSRFICRFGNLAKDYYWKYGIVVHAEGEKALVQVDYSKKEIIIRTKENCSPLALDMFYTIKGIDDFSKLEVSLSNPIVPEEVFGSVNYHKLSLQIEKGRKYLEWNNREFAVNNFLGLFNRNTIYHEKFSHKNLPKIENESSMIDAIRILVGQNRIEEIFKLFEKELKNENLNSAKRIESQWKELKRQKMMGLISFSDETIRRNNIVDSLMNFATSIEENKGDEPEIIENTLKGNRSNKNNNIRSGKGWEIREYPRLETNIIEVEMAANARNEIDLNSLDEKIKILFLAATPMDAGQINPGSESRFKDLIRYFDEENKFTFTEEHGVSSEQFQNFLVSQEPHIVHYGGHGETEGIVLEDEDLDGDVLAAILENSDNTQIVVLNACYSLEIAKEVAKHIPYVIGTQDAIDDSAATAFARGFYTGLVSGRSVEKAFKNGLISIKRKKLPDADVLVLVKGIKS